MTINIKIQNETKGGVKGCIPALLHVKLPCPRAWRQKERYNMG
jgi:hypothetical protein